MARTRRTITLDEKIQSEEAALAALKSRYDAKAAEIEQLRKRKPMRIIRNFLMLSIKETKHSSRF